MVACEILSPNDEQTYAGREHPLAVGGGPGVYTLGLGLLRWSILLSLFFSVILAWCFDMLGSAIIESIGGIWGGVVAYARSIPFFVLGCIIFSDQFAGWQVVGLLMTLEGIALYLYVQKNPEPEAELFVVEKRDSSLAGAGEAPLNPRRQTLNPRRQTLGEVFSSSVEEEPFVVGGMIGCVGTLLGPSATVVPKIS